MAPQVSPASSSSAPPPGARAVPREVTQRRLAVLSAATLQHVPTQTYTVADRLEARAAAHPARTFVRYRTGAVSYGRINTEANRIAHAARALGLRRGDVVALLMENRPAFLSSWLGFAKLGVTTALLNTHLRGAALRHAIDAAAPRLLLVGSECAEAVASLADAPPARPLPVHATRDPERAGEGAAELPRGAEDWDARIAAAPAHDPDPAVRAGLVAGDDLFYVYTSGTTGLQYVGEICRYLANQPRRPDDRDHRLRVMMGAGLGRDVWQVFRDRFGVERILEGWSSTEANTSLINLDGVVGSCGRIPFPELHNGRLVRYDPDRDCHPRDANGLLVPCRPGEVGEFIGMIPDLPDSGAGRFEGYTDPEASERKVLRDVFRPGDRWYRSGDLLRCDEEGYFYFVDRIGDTFRWKSENVSTQEVAEALSGFPELEIANVYGVRVPGAEGRAGMAALVLRAGTGFDGRAFFAWTRARLPEYAAPLFVRLAREADLTSTFKLRKVDLQRAGYDPARVGAPLFVRDPSAGGYVPLTVEALARLGIPPWQPGPEPPPAAGAA